MKSAGGLKFHLNTISFNNSPVIRLLAISVKPIKEFWLRYSKLEWLCCMIAKINFVGEESR